MPSTPSCSDAISQPLVASIGASNGSPSEVASHRHSLGSRLHPIALANTFDTLEQTQAFSVQLHYYMGATARGHVFI